MGHVEKSNSPDISNMRQPDLIYSFSYGNRNSSHMVTASDGDNPVETALLSKGKLKRGPTLRRSTLVP